MKKIPILMMAMVAFMAVVILSYYLMVINSKGTDEIRYIEPDAAYNSFAEILQHPDLKGKVVYVDYWHTGCGPCLKEFEYMPALKAKFKAQDDLAFLYLGKDRSAPGEKFRWKKMIENKKLSGDHYFMTNEKFSTLWNETVKDTAILMAFPHYLIVGRDGQILNNNAPRPGDALLAVELAKALKN